MYIRKSSFSDRAVRHWHRLLCVVGGHRPWRWSGTVWIWLVDMVGMGWQLDTIISVVFSNLNGSVILFYEHHTSEANTARSLF